MDAAETSHLHMRDRTQAGVITALRCLITALERHSLFVLLFVIFPRPKLRCAELGLGTGCHGDTQQRELMARWKSSAQVKSKEFIYCVLLPNPHRRGTTLIVLRDPVSPFQTCWQLHQYLHGHASKVCVANGTSAQHTVLCYPCTSKIFNENSAFKPRGASDKTLYIKFTPYK